MRFLEPMLPSVPACILALSLCSCDTDGGAGVPPETAAAIANYSELVRQNYSDTKATAVALAGTIDAFVVAPSAAGLDAAKAAWLTARESYLLTEAFRFYDGPIDEPRAGLESLMNSWPMDENFIDYVQTTPGSGAINNPQFEISAASLTALNEMGGEKNIATGYHAIEFLLWGQDTNPAGPGARPFTDFVVGEGGTAMNQGRRGMYLKTIAALLVANLDSVLLSWQPGVVSNYRGQLAAATPKEGLRRVLQGLIVLSGFETGGERIQTALDSGDQEDEHSCFSDNTHRDFVQDVQGIQNVYLGKYQPPAGALISGTSVKDVVAKHDAALATALDLEIAKSLALAKALVPPFDQEILAGNAAGRARVQALATALRTQEKAMAKVFSSFGLQPELPK